jgi:hypothetical protein
MIMEYNRAMHRGWYRDFIDPDFRVEGGFLYAPEEPGIGTRLRREVKERKDAMVRVSNEPGEPWLNSRKRYTYPPPEIQAEFEAMRPGARSD